MDNGMKNKRWRGDGEGMEGGRMEEGWRMADRRTAEEGKGD